MNQERLTLVTTTAGMKSALFAMADDFCAAGEDHYCEILDDFDAFVPKQEDYSQGRNLADGHVPATMFWLVRDDGTVLGRANLRHRLTRALEKEGGHIGYAICPSQRRKGYGARILALALLEARAFGLTRVLVTCDTDNVASTRIIQKNGGVLASEGISERSGKPICRYWIDLVPTK